jgi:metal-responsive CopG/Arc/MetJ family transcriptional regulator
MIEKPKEVRINVRLEKDTRDKFQKICKSKAVNSSELIRQWIEKYIQQNTDTE